MNEPNHNNDLRTLTGALGCLLLASDAERAVAVSHSDGQTLTLTLAGDAPGSFASGERGLAMLEATSPRGILRMLGDVAPASADSVRFAVVEVLEVSQRRSFVRRRAPRPIVVETRPEGVRIESFALELSGGGMLLAGAEQLEPGQRAWFRMRLQRGGTPIEGHARVVRVDAHGRRAIAFDSITEDDRERLIHFIFDHERAGRREARDGRAD